MGNMLKCALVLVAIPLLNFGIYVVLLEQFVSAIPTTS